MYDTKKNYDQEHLYRFGFITQQTHQTQQPQPPQPPQPPQQTSIPYKSPYGLDLLPSSDKSKPDPGLMKAWNTLNALQSGPKATYVPSQYYNGSTNNNCVGGVCMIQSQIFNGEYSSAGSTTPR